MEQVARPATPAVLPAPSLSDVPGSDLGIQAASSTEGEFRMSFLRTNDGTFTVVQCGKRTCRLKAP
ncbi:MAG: hypothetical protein LLG20_21040 [Acidobacteriales bacterium]|nr:hypothetical protein [Terriglobales bacterium]